MLWHPMTFTTRERKQLKNSKKNEYNRARKNAHFEDFLEWQKVLLRIDNKRGIVPALFFSFFFIFSFFLTLLKMMFENCNHFCHFISLLSRFYFSSIFLSFSFSSFVFLISVWKLCRINAKIFQASEKERKSWDWRFVKKRIFNVFWCFDECRTEKSEIEK